MNLLIVASNQLFDAVFNHFGSPDLIPPEIRDAMNDWVNVLGEIEEDEK